MGAVRGAEGVVDVDVAQLGQIRGERGIVRFLAGVEAQVLDQHDLAGLEVLGPAQRLEAGDFGRQPDVDAEQFAQSPRDRCERVLRINLAFRTPEVRAAHDLGPARPQVFDGRQRRADAQVVLDPAVAQRDVEVGAQQYPSAPFHREMLELWNRIDHRTALGAGGDYLEPTNSTISTRRFE